MLLCGDFCGILSLGAHVGMQIRSRIKSLALNRTWPISCSINPYPYLLLNMRDLATCQLNASLRHTIGFVFKVLFSIVPAGHDGRK